MAGSLNAQLAQIRIQGANPLDLKARKKTHSQSLIFGIQDAVDQDFDALFLICYEGFEELCRLDLRFTGFVSNIFSEQSKNEDRALMTAPQNAQLDAVIDQFLLLISERLLLRPALKSIEWLVRRFRYASRQIVCLYGRKGLETNLHRQNSPIQHDFHCSSLSTVP